MFFWPRKKAEYGSNKATEVKKNRDLKLAGKLANLQNKKSSTRNEIPNAGAA